MATILAGAAWDCLSLCLTFIDSCTTNNAGPGVAVKVIVVPREKVADAPLGEPFRVLTKEAAQQVRHELAVTHSISPWNHSVLGVYLQLSTCLKSPSNLALYRLRSCES